jgi:protein MPE1
MQAGVDGEDVKPPAGVMVNADGDFVIAEPDKASWAQYQAKTKSSAAAQKAASAEDKELEDKGLLCPIDKRMFIDPMKTPCCEKTYCNECITDALIQSDFVCPNCQTEKVLIDDLKVDDNVATQIQQYNTEKESAKHKERSQSPVAASSPSQALAAKDESPQPADPAGSGPTAKPKSTGSPTPPLSAKSPPVDDTQGSSKPNAVPNANSTPNPQDANNKKRPAEEELENPKIPKGPKAMQRQQETTTQNAMPQGMNGMGMMPNMMPFPMNMNGFPPNMNMNMNPMMNPMMGMNPMMNPMMGMNPMMNPMMGMNGMNGFNGGGMNGMGGNMQGFGMQQQQQHHQLRTNFTTPNNDDEAYFRKPVNPGRVHKQRRARPSDYKQL